MSVYGADFINASTTMCRFADSEPVPAQFISPEAAELAGADVDNHTRPGPEGKRNAAAGWYHIFHIDDIRQIAPRWLYWCKFMRLNPQMCAPPPPPPPPLANAHRRRRARRYWKMTDPETGKSSIPKDILTGDAYVTHGQVGVAWA